jgi:hypothetical protein
VVQSCNLTGTFAGLNEMDLEWDPVLFSGVTVIAGGSATTFSYSINRLSQDGNTVSVETIACGGTSPDVCSPLFMQAYGQVIPDNVWGLPSMPVDSYDVTLAGAPDPGDPFVGPTVGSLLGLGLTNPTGPWPVSRTDPAITWLDHDVDGQPGVTSLMISGGTSAACNFPYGNLPIPATGAYASRVYTGTRSLGNVDGTIDDCNTLSGVVAGPANGLPVLNGHVVGCLKDNSEPCTDAETQSLDEGGNSAGQRILRTSFVMVRASDTITCAQVRAMNFP